eukprot:SAG25_NODE_919_length_4769_cov_1.695289_2_plen_76_part_00
MCLARLRPMHPETQARHTKGMQQGVASTTYEKFEPLIQLQPIASLSGEAKGLNPRRWGPGRNIRPPPPPPPAGFR